MADILNLPDCSSPDSVFNTGVPACDIKKKKILGLIFVDKGKVFTAAQCASIATFLAAMLTATTAARGSRAYPFWKLLNFNDATGQPGKGGVGNLTTAQINTSDPIPLFTFGYDGGELQHKRLVAIMGGSYDVLFVDSQYAVYGTANGDDLGGYSLLDIYVPPSKYIVADAVDQYAIEITLSSITEYRDQSRFLKANSTLSSYRGLVSVPLKLVSSSTNAHTISFIADGGTNLQTVYTTTIDATLVVAKNMTTGAAMTLTSVTGSSGNYVVTIDSTQWAALASGTVVQINLGLSATLSAAGVKPYEGIAMLVTKP